MATRTWNSSGNTDMNNTSNYSGSGSFTTDDLVFNNTSVVNSTATSGITCNSITIASNYTGTWSLSGQTATIASGFSDDGITGAHNYGNGISMSANGTLHVGSGVNGGVTSSSCAITLGDASTDTITFDDDKGLTIKSLTVNGAVTSSGAATTTILGGGTLVTLNNNSSFTVNRFLSCQLNADGTWFSVGTGVTFNGSAEIDCAISANNITCGLTALTFTGTSVWYLFSNGSYTGWTINYNGNINLGTAAFNCYSGASGSSGTLNTNNYSVTCGMFRVGAPSTETCNFGSSTFSIVSFGTSVNPYSATLNFSTSQWTVSGGGANAWIFGSTYTVSGSPLVMFNGTAAQTITSNGVSFYDVTINRTTAGTCLFSDATSLHTLTVSATNTQVVSWTGTTMTASGDCLLDGTGTYDCGNAITMNGASSILRYGASISGISGWNSCVITFNGTTAPTFVVNINDSNGIKQLVLGASAVCTLSGAASYIYIGYNNTSGNWIYLNSGALLTCNSLTLNFYPTFSPYTMFYFSTNAQMKGSSNLTSTISSTPQTISIVNTGQKFYYTGSGVFTFTNTGASYNVTINMNGEFSSTGNLSFGSSGANNVAVFNTGNYAFTCATLNMGSSNASGNFTFNAGSSVCSISALSATYNSGTNTWNFSTSQWSCSGNWTFGSNWTINGTAASTSVTVTNTATVTNNGKVFPGSLSVNASGKTITLADALSVAGNLTWTAGSLSGAFSTTCAGNVTTAASVTFNRLILTKVTTRRVTIGAGTTLTLSNLTNTNVNGTAGNLTEWRSSTPGVAANLAIPAPITLQYQYPQDNAASALITADDYTSMNGGNNTNWQLPPTGASGYMKYW